MSSRPLPLIPALLLLLVAPLRAETHAELRARALDRLAALESFELRTRLTLKTITTAATDSHSYTMRSAGVWPDRLTVAQTGDGANVHLGTGPQGGWFHLEQLAACYQGAPVPLDRDPGAPGSDFMLSGRFSFLMALSPLVLPSQAELGDLEDRGEFTVVVDGSERRCRMLEAKATEGIAIRRFWVDLETGLILKSTDAMTAEKDGQYATRSVEQRVELLELGGPVPDGRFRYEPPAGVRIADHRDRLLNPDALSGEPAPAVVFRDLEGRDVRLSDYRGRVLFLDVWATWCAPCRQEMPHIQRLHDEFEGTGVEFLAVSSEAPDVIREFLRENPYTFPVARVSERDAALKLKVRNIPTGLVIDREGVVRAHLVGAQNEQQLRAALARAGVE